MTKEELINKIDDIMNRMDDLAASIGNADDEARAIRKLIRELPDAADQIEDDEDEEVVEGDKIED